MNLSRERLQSQIAHFQQEQNQARETYLRCEGAIKLCQAWLADIEREEQAKIEECLKAMNDGPAA